MKFYVTKDVFEKIPDGKFGLVSVTGADNTGNNPEIRAFLQENVEKCTEFYTGKKVKNEPELQPYREAFRNMGINPNRYMCAIEALMTRIAKGQGMPAINTIVDLGNGVSLKHHLPIGAHDLDTMIDGAFGRRGYLPAIRCGRAGAGGSRRGGLRHRQSRANPALDLETGK